MLPHENRLVSVRVGQTPDGWVRAVALTTGAGHPAACQLCTTGYTLPLNQSTSCDT